MNDPKAAEPAANSAQADKPYQTQSISPRVTTGALMQGGRRLVIQHNDDDYVLQITRSGRLILTK